MPFLNYLSWTCWPVWRLFQTILWLAQTILLDQLSAVLGGFVERGKDLYAATNCLALGFGV